MQLEDEFGDVIAKARLGSGLSHAQIAASVGLNEPQLSEIEHYRLKPSEDVVRLLAKALDLDPKKLVETASGAWTPQPVNTSRNSFFVHPIHVPFGPYGQNSYIVACPQARLAAVVDPGGTVDEITNALHDQQLTLEMVLITHAHADHIGGLHELIDSVPEACVVCSPIDRDAVMQGMDCRWHPAEDGTQFELGRVRIKACATPGHTPGSTCYIADQGCFVGDTLFAGSIGRPASSAGYARMISTIKSKVLSLPGDTMLLPGHGPMSTVAEELEHNPFF